MASGDWRVARDRGSSGHWCLCAFLVILLGAPGFAQRRQLAPPAQSQSTPPQTAPQAALTDAEGEALIKAEQAIDAKDYAGAITILKAQLARGSNHYRFYFDLGYATTMTGEIPAAIEAYRRVLERDASVTEASVNLAILLTGQQRAAEAVPLLEKAVQQEPREVSYVVLLAEALALSGNPARAAEQYRKAIALDPESSTAYLGLGHVLAGERRFSEAVKQLWKAAELQPGDFAIRLEIGEVLEAAGQNGEALALYQEIAARQPDNALVHRRLARLFTAARKFDQAAVELATAARLAPSADDERSLAIAYARAKRAGEAIPRLQKLAASLPGDYDVRLLLGEMLLSQRQFAEAQKELEAAAALRPEIPDAWVDLANDLYMQQNYAGTVQILERLSRMAPETPWLDFLRAISLDKLGQAKPALESYQKFLAISRGQLPDQEFQARQRIKALQQVLERGGGRKER